MNKTQAQFGFALEYVKDIDATRRFFVDVLGLEVDRDHPTFVQFKSADGASYAITSDEPVDGLSKEHGESPELWWVVEDAEAALADMSRKAELSMQLRQMPFGKCFGVKDPAGQVHYVLEFARERPSVQVS
jgi:catechol 2,3-dioxygenase-like lactoylglutathione lyase family enzyme